MKSFFKDVLFLLLIFSCLSIMTVSTVFFSFLGESVSNKKDKMDNDFKMIEFYLERNMKYEKQDHHNISNKIDSAGGEGGSEVLVFFNGFPMII